MMRMGTLMTIAKNLILSRRIKKELVLTAIDGADADGDGYISVREALDLIAFTIRSFAKRYGE